MIRRRKAKDPVLDLYVHCIRLVNERARQPQQTTDLINMVKRINEIAEVSMRRHAAEILPHYNMNHMNPAWPHVELFTRLAGSLDDLVYA